MKINQVEPPLTCRVSSVAGLAGNEFPLRRGGARWTPNALMPYSVGMPTNSTPERLPMPSQGEAHVWTVSLSENLQWLNALEPLLSTGESQRAARFLRPDDRSRYIVAHGCLRQIIGRYLSVSPEKFVFSQNAFGKPSLAGCFGLSELSFNIAHSGDVILYALTVGRRVGVDVEAIRPDIDIMALARGQFSLQEFAVLQALEPAEQRAAFFRCWTRKEACVKALGEGLSFNLKQFSVAIGPADAPALLWSADGALAPERWSVWDWPIIAGYAAAVVCEGRPIRFVARHWISAC